MTPGQNEEHWTWPLQLDTYDRNPELYPDEWSALDALIQHFTTGKQRWPAGHGG